MVRWGLVIDLRKCIGCQTCTVVCNQTNNVPPGASWRKVIDLVVDENSNAKRVSLPLSCMHCNSPPCLEVCPTTATYRRPDGIVDINYELCVGCGYCILACPYFARTITSQDESFNFEMVDVMHENYTATSSQSGVCTKCNFCLPRIETGLASGLKPGIDLAASPACVAFCSAKALYFGDLEDPESVVSRLIRENKTVRLQEELGTDPSVYYIVE